jgi:hypothetical protein
MARVLPSMEDPGRFLCTKTAAFGLAGAQGEGCGISDGKMGMCSLPLMYYFCRPIQLIETQSILQGD